MYSDYNPNENPIPTTIMRLPPPIKVEKPAKNVVTDSFEYNPAEIPIQPSHSALPASIKDVKTDLSSLQKKYLEDRKQVGVANSGTILPPTIRITRENSDDEIGLCQYILTPEESVEIGNYWIGKVCNAKGGCGHYIRNKQSGKVYWKAGHLIYKMLMHDGYSHPHFDKFKNWEEEIHKQAQQNYAELEAKREKERLEIERTIEYQQRMGENRNWKR